MKSVSRLLLFLRCRSLAASGPRGGTGVVLAAAASCADPGGPSPPRWVFLGLSGVKTSFQQNYSLSVYLVKQLTSVTLLQKLRAKGIRNPDHSRALSEYPPPGR